MVRDSRAQTEQNTFMVLNRAHVVVDPPHFDAQMEQDLFRVLSGIGSVVNGPRH